MKIKKNGEIINLTEKDLKRIVKRTLNEGSESIENKKPGVISYTSGNGKTYRMVSIKDVLIHEKELGMEKFELIKKFGDMLHQFDSRQAFSEILQAIIED